MHFSPYHKKRIWQIFIVGIMTGAILAYFIFTYMHGKMYEEVLLDKIQLQTKVEELQRQNFVLQQDKEHLQEKNTLTINMIEIEYINSGQLKLDRLITHQFDVLIKEELHNVIGKDSASLMNVDQLLISLIENRQYTIDELTYEFEVRKLFISEKLKISLFVKLVK